MGTDGCTLDAFYLETANITLAAPAAGASNHTPIGVVGAAFTGTYDGGGFTIDGLVVVMAGDHVGLFGRTDSGVTIRNVHVTRGSITGREYTGGLMGTAIGAAVSGSSFSGTVTSSVGVVGGLIGYAANSTDWTRGEINNTSIVLRATVAGAGSVLLAGDAEREAQADLLANHRDRLRADVLVVPHHCSRTSDPDFLLATGASLAIISVGRGNRHGHPAVEIVDALEAAGVDVRRTDRDGTVRIGLAGIAAG